MLSQKRLMSNYNIHFQVVHMWAIEVLQSLNGFKLKKKLNKKKTFIEGAQTNYVSSQSIISMR